MKEPLHRRSGSVTAGVVDASSPTKTPDKKADQVSDFTTMAAAARAKASNLMSTGRYSEARAAIDEAEALEKQADQHRRVEAGRSKAAELIEQGRFADARRVIAEVEAIAEESPDAAGGDSPRRESIRIVNLYSKLAAVVGLLPGNILNFAAILAVQVVMVWRIATVFGHSAGKDKIRGAILSLFGSALPTVVGHGTGTALAAIPAVIASTVVYFLVTPVLAYAMTQAVGKTFIMHFESGGTLLTFDPQAFGEYFMTELRAAGGTTKTEAGNESVVRGGA